MLAACSRAPEKQRFAVLVFENLTGDPSLDWMEAAAPSIIASDLGATRAGSVADAYLLNATHVIHGTYTSRGFEISVENAARHKLSGFRTYKGPLLAVMNAAAKEISPSARAFSATREDAVDAWGHRDFEKAVALDPGFGAAWLAWIETLAQRGDTAQASSVAAQALARSDLRSDLDRARIELLAATLANDPPRRAAAFARIAKLTDDPASRLALAEAELNARNFDAAVSAYQSALEANPNDPATLLSLGYAQAYEGKLDAAQETFEKYGRQPGQKTNSLDSLGEGYFMNGRFTDAEKYFLEVHQSDPAFMNGIALLKAAYAHWMAGDLKGADAIAAKYFRDPWNEASWLYATGRREQALAKLQSVSDRRLIDRQAAVWNTTPPSDLATLKSAYERTAPSSDGLARALYAAALVKAGQKDEARKLTRRWPLPAEQGIDALLASLVYPIFIEARKAAAE